MNNNIIVAAGQLKQGEDLPSARSHFGRKDKSAEASLSPKLTTENIKTELINEGSSAGEIDDEKDDVIIDEVSGFDIPGTFQKKEEPLKVQPVEKNQVRVVPDLKMIRDHKFLKSGK